MKKNKIPYHIAHNYKEYSYTDGELTITFWAKDDKSAELYKKKMNDPSDSFTDDGSWEGR